jgi:hypothetical protein
LAFRPAGLAFSSGFAWLIGCPGGAEGFLMLSKIGRASFLDLLFGEFFFGIEAVSSGEDYLLGRMFRECYRCLERVSIFLDD